MICPYCQSNKSHVMETRQVHSEKNGDGLRRTRKCLMCKRNFHTVEWVKKGESKR